FSTISALIMSLSSSLLSARTLTICTRPGVRICLCETFKCSLGWRRTIKTSDQLSVASSVPSEQSRYQLTTGHCVSHQRKTFPQINPSDFRIASQLFRRPMPENSSFVDDVGPIGYGKRLAYIVICNQNPNPGCFHIADDFLQIQHRNG